MMYNFICLLEIGAQERPEKQVIAPGHWCLCPFASIGHADRGGHDFQTCNEQEYDLGQSSRAAWYSLSMHIIL